MPKLATIQTNFTGGELSPLIYSGRVDTAKYPNGAARMENFRATIQGGAVSAPGTRFLGMAKGRARLIPFVHDRDAAYQVELGVTSPSYIRIWRADGTPVGAPLELAAPWDLLAASELTYEQAEDTMFFFHKDWAPRRLQRLSDTNWKLEVVPFVTPAFHEQGLASTVGITLSAATVGAGRTLTAASPVFLPADVGRDLYADQGIATITAYTDSQHVTADISSAFASTSVASWQLADSPMAFLYASQKDPAGSTVVLSSSLTRQANITLSNLGGGSITVTADAAVFAPSDGGKTLYADTGVGTITYTDATHLTVDSGDTAFLRKQYQKGGWAITGDAFRAGDVGSFVQLNGGLLKIAGFTSASAVDATILVSPTALVAAPGGAWALLQASFSATNGYPRCGALHEQRLYVGGSSARPQAVDASRIGAYLDFEPGVLDADGFSYTANSRQRNPIQHLVSGKRLFAFTTGMEMSLRGGNEKAIGPTNIQKDNESAFGASGVRPVPIGKEVLFVQGGGRKVRALGYSAATDGYDSPDRTVFAEHVTGYGIAEMAFNPSDSVLYAVRADGQLAVCTYDVSQEVIAWARYVTPGGLYISVSVVPLPLADETWVVVARPGPSGGFDYHIERFEESLSMHSASLRTDDTGVTFTTISGFGRFEGRQVTVKADGINVGSKTVVGGVVTIDRPARSIEAGLPFVPTLELLPPEPGGGGTAQGSNISVHEVTVKVLDTAAIEINGQLSDFRQFGSELLDQPPPGYSGDFRAFTLTDGDFTRPTLVIRQPLPYRTRVQAVVRKVTFNDV